MELSRKDRLIIVAMWAIGMVIILLIAYDPLDILDITQKVIIVVIITIVFLPLLLYQRQRIIKKTKKPT
jgi:Mn2+/Fe2+ NRAMP family transporter